MQAEITACRDTGLRGSISGKVGLPARSKMQQRPHRCRWWSAVFTLLLSVHHGGAQLEGTIPDMLRVNDFAGTDFLFVGEPYRYFNLFSHKDYQLNALMAPSSDHKRIAERNLMISPDSAIVELTLQHTDKLGHATTVQFRAVYANSFSTRIDGDYLVPPHVERNGLRIIPGMAMKEGGVANGIPPGRQVVTVVTPMFTMWVWAGLPEWPAHPDRVAEAYPSLHSRMFIPKDPLGPVHGLLGGSMKRVNSSRPLVASMASGSTPVHLWSAYRPLTAGTAENLKAIDGKEADYRVTGPLAADFQFNAYEGVAPLQEPAAYEARIARYKAISSVMGF